MNPLRVFRSLTVPLLCCLAVIPAAALEPALPEETDPAPVPVLRAGDVTAPAPHHDVKLFFPWALGVDPASLGDGDLAARGPNGYAQRARLVSVERLPLPFPAEPTHPSIDGLEVAPLPQPEPILVATYRFLPPGGADDTWTPDDNGTYGVSLLEKEIVTEDGRYLPPMVLGAFEVRILPGPGVPVQPDEVRCAICRAPTDAADTVDPELVYHAVVRMFFSTPHVDVEWGDVTRRDRTITAKATALRGPLTASPLLQGPAAELLRPSLVHRYRLGPLEPGAWRFVFMVNGVEECVKEFVIPPDPPVDDEPPTARLAVRDIHLPSERAQRLLVRYEDRSGVDPSTIGDGDLVVFSPCGLQDGVDPAPCGWRARRARLVEIVSVSSDHRILEAMYEIDAPSGGWTSAHNGFYPVALWDAAVCDRLGNCVERQRLGGFVVRIDPGSPPVPADAVIRVDASNPNRVVAKVHIDFHEPWQVVGQDIRRIGNRIYLIAKAEPLATPAVFPPSPPPQQDLVYEIGALREGTYAATFVMNGHAYDTTTWKVEPPSCEPLPHVVDIRIGQGDVSWFSTVVVALFPGQRVTDWGEVRRDGDTFHVRITVECFESPGPLDPEPVLGPGDVVLPAGMAFDAAGNAWLGRAPIRLVSHTYPLGPLDPGKYGFVVHSRGTTVARKAFEVPGTAPRVELSVANITEPSDAHRFGITYYDPDGLDHDSIARAEVVVVGRDGYREIARLLSYAASANEPSTGASARYAVRGPAGSWDSADNGRYQVWVDPTAIRDVHGTAIEDGWLGGFRVRIVPPSEPGVNVTVAAAPSGHWGATVEIVSEPAQQVVVESWGPLILHGQVFVALASVHLEPTNGPVEPLAHTYNLGLLPPGEYLFVFTTNLAHFGTAGFTVPGLEGDPVANWAMRSGITPGDENAALTGYYFALDPSRPPSPRIRPEIVEGDGGRRHPALRFRRLQGAEGVREIIEGTRDFGAWEDVTDRLDLMDRVLGRDGTEEVLLCLRDALEETDLRYFRIRIVRDNP